MPAQGLALNQFRHDKVCGSHLSEFVNGQNVRMVESRGGPRFLLEATYAFVIPGEMSEQNFERNLATEPGVFRQINFSHAAGSEPLGYQIRPELASNHR